MKAYLRLDLLEQDLEPDYFVYDDLNMSPIDWSLAYECWQPESIDCDEYNMILLIPKPNGFNLIGVNTIDFEWENE